jgi:hypothetical protein
MTRLTRPASLMRSSRPARRSPSGFECQFGAATQGMGITDLQRSYESIMTTRDYAESGRPAIPFLGSSGPPGRASFFYSPATPLGARPRSPHCVTGINDLPGDWIIPSMLAPHFACQLRRRDVTSGLTTLVGWKVPWELVPGPQFLRSSAC